MGGGRLGSRGTALDPGHSKVACSYCPHQTLYSYARCNPPRLVYQHWWQMTFTSQGHRTERCWGVIIWIHSFDAGAIYVPNVTQQNDAIVVQLKRGWATLSRCARSWSRIRLIEHLHSSKGGSLTTCTSTEQMPPNEALMMMMMIVCWTRILKVGRDDRLH